MWQNLHSCCQKVVRGMPSTQKKNKIR